MRTIGLVTVARSDYTYYLPLLRRIESDSDLDLYLIVSGMHLSPEFGHTVKTIESDGFNIGERVEMLLSSDTPKGIAKSIGIGVLAFSESLSRFRPDILVVLGDRFEMYTAALSALPLKIPVAHLYGGELSEGAMDDALRHSITKMSHLHFVSTREYAHRIIQLGEEPWRVFVSGALSLENLSTLKLMTIEELESQYGIRLKQKPLLITYHPVTLQYDQTEWQIGELLAALEKIEMPIIFTFPNADTNGRIIINMIKKFVNRHNSAWVVENMGAKIYFSMMRTAAAMVGNSSSGIIEAASFKLPVVNIGIRQRGRIRAMNVIDVGYSRIEIIEGIKRAIQPEFKERLNSIVNPYDAGRASEIITKELRDICLDDTLMIKQFYNIPVPAKMTGMS